MDAMSENELILTDDNKRLPNKDYTIREKILKNQLLKNSTGISIMKNLSPLKNDAVAQISGKDFYNVEFDEEDYISTNKIEFEGLVSFISVTPELVVLIIKNETVLKRGKLLSLQITVSGEIGQIRTLHSGNIVSCSSSYCGTYIMVITVNQDEIGQIHYLKPPYSLQTVGYNMYDVRSVACLPDNTIIVIGKMDYDDWSLFCWTAKCKRLKWKEKLPSCLNPKNVH
ncbi:unnamed protein product [Dimorphilus gyrociliatus]|uniref:Uncharacterized protein n=1 Tax=Dimorphilus gyrociliatus TaxID=2664684 RepID=A0A7I8V5G2_9ANNE|nr:unnamed protein product [Dimorphilus gyrociliatus]